MSYSIEALKDLIEKFIAGEQTSSIAVKESERKSSMLVNRNIFNLESFLVELRQRYHVNDRIDTSISSKHILDNFGSMRAGDSFDSPDYQFNFLYFLVGNHEPGKDLYHLIDGFIKDFKDQFSLADIVITKSGATRCKTNIRFALNDLRDLGLVLSKDINERRTWAPSLAGLVVLTNILLFPEHFLTQWGHKHPLSLRTATGLRVSQQSAYDPILISSIRDFKKYDHIYSYLARLRFESVPTREVVEQIMTDYINFVNEGLEITDTGVKAGKKFYSLSATFQAKLFSMEKRSEEFRNKLVCFIRNSLGNESHR
jgi:hypothetical protein